jgi:hypothetical protein
VPNPPVRWRQRSRLVRAARLLRTRRPQTFTEKVRYKMLRDHRMLLVTFADKAAVREYVAERVGAEYLPEAYAIVRDPERLRELDLPESYVVKPTHGSGAAIVVSRQASEDQALPPAVWGWVYRHVQPSAVTIDALVDIGRVWMTKLYGQGPNREWAYGKVEPAVIVEEMLVAPGGIPDDYKFFVFHGRCRYIQVDAGRFDERTQDFYDADWQHLPMSGGPAACASTSTRCPIGSCSASSRATPPAATAHSSRSPSTPSSAATGRFRAATADRAPRHPRLSGRAAWPATGSGRPGARHRCRRARPTAVAAPPRRRSRSAWESA